MARLVNLPSQLANFLILSLPHVLSFSSLPLFSDNKNGLSIFFKDNPVIFYKP